MVADVASPTADAADVTVGNHYETGEGCSALEASTPAIAGARGSAVPCLPLDQEATSPVRRPPTAEETQIAEECHLPSLDQ
eukprot:3737286-Prorocentrum_lima.AAC.1